MNAQFKSSMVFALLFFALTGWTIETRANGEAEGFLWGYKAYLKKDFKLAFLHWKPLAEAGHSDAQYFLGIMYLNGQGITTNWTEAAHWFEACARQGDAGAQFLFGEMNLKGMGLIQDHRKAGVWFKKAAEQGYPDAQFRLGEWYADGKGGETDFLLAYVWLKLAGANGIQAGDTKRKQVETRLTPKEIRQANQLAYQWWSRLDHQEHNLFNR